MRLECAHGHGAVGRRVDRVRRVGAAKHPTWCGQPVADRRGERAQGVEQANHPTAARPLVHHLDDGRVRAFGAKQIRE